MTIVYKAGQQITGLSTDTKPSNQVEGTEFTETNTGKIFVFSSGSWTERTSGLSVTDDVTIGSVTATLGDWLEIGADVPSLSTALTTVSNTSSQITLSWTKKTKERVSKHKVEYSTDNSSWTTATNVATGSSYAVTGLSAYTDYYFRISPTNIMGTGGLTTTGSVTKTQGITPSNIANFTASAVSTTQINLSWDASTGTPTPTYKVEYKLSSAGSWTELEASQSGTTYNKTGLTVYTDYDFRVTALNAQGSSPTVTLTSVTTDGVVPAQVAGLSLVSAKPDVDMSWTADSTGVPSVITYTVEHSLTGSGSWSVVNTTTGTTLTDSNVTLDVAHYYRVKGTNAFGTGTYSAVSNVTVATSSISVTGSPTESTSGGYNYYEFLQSGTVTIEGYTPDILIVNGGNSASGANGGSGGEIRQITGQTGLSGTYTITIGGANTASVFSGESGYTTTSGAGGGAGSHSYNGVAGGAGTEITSFPATYSYSGGGGGGAGQQNSNYRGGAGGTGGGGGGGRGKNGWGGYAGSGGRNSGQQGSNQRKGYGGYGGANTGSGGGGGGRYNGVGSAGSGGSGVFVLRVPT